MDKVAMMCCHCHGTKIIRNGRTSNGKQRYKCKSCGRSSRTSPQSPGGYSPEQRAKVLQDYYERPSLRRIERAFGVSRVTLIKWRKQEQRF